MGRGRRRHITAASVTIWSGSRVPSSIALTTSPACGAPKPTTRRRPSSGRPAPSVSRTSRSCEPIADRRAIGDQPAVEQRLAGGGAAADHVGRGHELVDIDASALVTDELDIDGADPPDRLGVGPGLQDPVRRRAAAPHPAAPAGRRHRRHGGCPHVRQRSRRRARPAPAWHRRRRRRCPGRAALPPTVTSLTTGCPPATDGMTSN